MAQHGAQAELDDLIVYMELTLIAIVQGIALFLLVEGTAEIIDSRAYRFAPFVVSGSPGQDVEAVDVALFENQACLPPVVLCEILSDPKLPRALEEIVLQIPTLELAAGFWVRAGRLRARVAAAGHKAKPADTLIALSCLDHDVALVTREGDFSHFAVAGLQLLPAARRK